MVMYEVSADLLAEFARDVKEGLGSRRKHLKPKYFYDRAGSQLYEEICRQPEYYLRRTEEGILRKRVPEILAMCDTDISMVELGSGSSSKTRILLRYILTRQKQLYYFPIDISPTLQETVQRLSNDFPNIRTIAINSDYYVGIKKINELIAVKDLSSDGKLILFLGSSIGNFEPRERVSFLRSIRDGMERKDVLLVGFDLQKEREILEAAYNDRADVTAKFNLNLLTRINRVLGGEFDLKNFSHRAFYNETEQRMEMHLLSETPQDVRVSHIGQTYRFEKGETIHTENSYKYTPDQIRVIAEDGGFKVKRNFLDEKNWFNLAFLSPI